MVVPTEGLIEATPGTTLEIRTCIDVTNPLHTRRLSQFAQRECGEQPQQLATGLWRALGYVVENQGSQMAALRLGDTRTGQFEGEIIAVLQGFRRARKRYMEHVQDHGC
jgi:hypothetical protein